MVVRELGLRFELEVLHVGDDLLFGTGNICGRLAGGPRYGKAAEPAIAATEPEAAEAPAGDAAADCNGEHRESASGVGIGNRYRYRHR
jgi:hypothetical protein